jgi:hypothetical protein
MFTLATTPDSDVASGTRANQESVLQMQVKPSLEWLIGPLARPAFFEQYWEKQPLVVKRDQPG